MTDSQGGTRAVAFERGQIVLAAATAIAGGIIGWLVPVLFSNPEKIELWLIVAAAILVITAAAAGVSYHHLLRRTSEDTLNTTKELISTFASEAQLKIGSMAAGNTEVKRLVEESIGRQASLIPRDLVYREMAISIRNAREQVAIISYLMVDWETGKRTFLPASVDTPFRGEFYDAVYEAIRNPKVEYIRVWEVPHNRVDEAMKVVESDESQRKECALIREVGRNRPDLARLVVADQLTTASFVLIDQRSLFLNIDFFDPQNNVWYSPYMLFVKDASGEAFNDLRSIIVRLTGRS